MKKNFLSIMMTLCMLVSLMPAVTLTAEAVGGAEWTASEYEFNPGGSDNAYLLLRGIQSSNRKEAPAEVILDLGEKYRDMDSVYEAYENWDLNMTLRYANPEHEEDPDEPEFSECNCEDFNDYSLSFIDNDGNLVISGLEVSYYDDIYRWNITLKYSVHLHHLCGDTECRERSHALIEFEPWTERDYLPDTPGSYYLTSDIELSEAWSVPTGGPVNLCLNGQVIRLEDDEVHDSVINVVNGAVLNLCDCNDESGQWLSIGEEGLWTLDEDGDEYLSGGFITGGWKDNGGGVYVASGGSFNMHGGNIVGNAAEVGGGGVYVDENAALKMTGGQIIGNISCGSGGGGIEVKDSTSSVTIGGTAVVRDNKYAGPSGTEKNNVHLSGGAGIIIGTGNAIPKSGMEVYINGEEGTTFVNSGGNPKYAKYFKADNDELDVLYVPEGNKLKLGTCTFYPLWVSGVQVTSENKTDILNDGKISYDESSNTLSLNGVNISYGENDDDTYGIYYEGSEAFTIKVTGTNTFTAVRPENYSCGIYSEESDEPLTILGTDKANDKLVFTAKMSSETENQAVMGYNVDINKVGITVSNYDSGLHGLKSLAITDSALDITARGYTLHSGYEGEGSIAIDSSTVFGYSFECSAINVSEDISISGSTVEAYSQIGSWDCGISCDSFTIDGESKLVACGDGAISGSVSDKTGFTASTDYFGDDLAPWNEVEYAQKVVYKGGEQSVLPLFVAGEIVRKGKTGDILGDGKVSYDISSKTLTLNGENITGDVHTIEISRVGRRIGVYSLLEDELKVRLIGNNKLGKEATGSSEESYSLDYGIMAKGDITITGPGNLNINDYNAGISGNGNVTFDSAFTGTVNIRDYGATAYSCAIQALGDVNLLGGSFNLKSENTHGIKANGTLTINNGGGTVTAGGGMLGIYADGMNLIAAKGLLAYGRFAGIALDSSATPPALEMLGSADLYENPASEINTNIIWEDIEGGLWPCLDEEGEEPNPALTVKLGFIEQPAPSRGKDSDAPVTVPVTGEKETVKVEATVSGSTATVKDITEADLNKVSGGGNVEIDLSGLNKNIDSAKIPAATVEKIAEQSGMTVKLSTATVSFDRDASASITEQAQGETIELVVDDIKKDSLNTAQKEAVKDIKMEIVIDAYLVSGGARICSSDKGGFGKGEATVILPYDIKDSASKYSVYYIDDKGKLENLNARYDENLKSFVFKISHFSNYAIAYDESAVSSFVDVPSNAYYYDAVKWAAANGITAGIDDTHFGPSLGTTRAQVVTFLWRAAGSPEPAGNANKFADVKAGSYYEKAVSWAIENGITNGTAATSFSPDSTCTRAQIVTFLYRFAGIDTSDIKDNPFIDVADGQFYHDAALWAAENGITTGVSKNLFSPDSSCIRAQIVTFLYRYMGK